MTCCSAWACSRSAASDALGLDARGVLRREVLPLEAHRTEPQQSDLGGWSPREACTKSRQMSIRCVHQRAQPARPRHHGGCRDGFRRASSKRVCASTPNATSGRWTTCTCHIAWRALAHHGVFEGARNPAPHAASVLARPGPTRFSPVASVENGTGRAPVPVPARIARHDRAPHCPISTQKPLNRRAPQGSFTDACRACSPEAAISNTACDGPTHVRAFFFFSGLVRPVLRHGPWSQTVGEVFFVGAKTCKRLEIACLDLAQATDCDLKSRSRQSISVRVSLFLISLLFSLSTPLRHSSFSSPSLLSFSVSPLSSSSSSSSCHHSSSPIFNVSDQNDHFLHFYAFSCHLSLQSTDKTLKHGAI